MTTKKTAKANARTKAAKAARAAVKATKAVAKANGRETKQATVLAMLEKGATLEAIMEKTGWLSHTTRGFLSAVVRKKLGLNLVRGENGVYQTA